MVLLTKTKIEQVTADLLLGIPETEPEKLFSVGNTDQVKKEYRELAKIWHTDHNHDPQATNVMQRLSALYAKANEKIKEGKWEIPNVFTFQTVAGKKYKINYIAKRKFDLGDMYIADASVAFVLDKSERTLFNNAKDIISTLKYPDAKMRSKLESILPQVKADFETSEKLIMVLKKEPDEILLSDVVAHDKGKIEPTHAAWMISRFHNFSCYLDWAGLTHNGLATDTCFISPQDHSVNFLGGWWYAAKTGAKLKALPAKTVAIVPPKLFDKPIANPEVDLSLIRAVGREILGDATGMSLIGNKSVPKDMTAWVNGVSSGNAQDDFRIWSKTILAKSFGVRRFVEMKLSPNDIYQP